MNKTPIVLKGAAALADIAGPATAYVADVEFDVVHHVPGRLRLRSPTLKGNARGIERRRQQLADIAGIVSADAKPATGSFLLTYDSAALPPGEGGRRAADQSRDQSDDCCRASSLFGAISNPLVKSDRVSV